MATRPSLLGYRHNAVLRARDGAPDEQQVSLCVYPHNSEADFGVAFRAHVPRHPLSLDDARRVSAGADRARLPVTGIAVGCRTTPEAVAVHHALEPSTLCRACHLDQFAGGEDVYLHFGTGRRGFAIYRKASKHLRSGFEPGLLGMTQLCLAGPLRPPGTEPELYPTIAGLKHPAGTSLDHAHRNRSAVFLKDSSHAELAAD